MRHRNLVELSLTNRCLFSYTSFNETKEFSWTFVNQSTFILVQFFWSFHDADTARSSRERRRLKLWRRKFESVMKAFPSGHYYCTLSYKLAR